MRTVALASQRPTFSPFEAGDLDLLVGLHSDPRVQRHLTPDGSAWGRDVLQAKLDAYRSDYCDHGWSEFAAFDGDGTFVGRAGFGRFEVTGELELGFSFVPAVWGRGYATEAARALLGWIYGHDPAVGHVIAFAAAGNVASQAVLRKAGMWPTHVADVHGMPFAFFRHGRP